ncbi:hypothetical protein QBC35DRAFT_285941 [Podospora australis]|uniref:JmjC domain-containing protein n=1 Tax=Podospora australis TaxID=1536484 RepID=A0AAN7AHM2_9PEZI|nr:hypothetical protein QBC35DRAFT_285941 [Podospora australis]
MAPTAQHPQAKFDPIPPDLDLHALVEQTPNFKWVTRISAAQIRSIGPQEFEKLVKLHVIHQGKPLVIEKWQERLPKSLFSGQWLEDTYNKKQENVRDIVGQQDIPMTTGHYLRSMKQLTNQWTPTNFRDERRQRLYLKDIDCPPEWQEYLAKVIPPNLYYMNENVESRSGKKRDEDFDMFQESRSAAPAGDLMSSLPEEMRAQNLMCYVGHEGTYTPAHREMCASLGQNIMVDASGDENGEKAGSSVWFMTESKDREVVREYFLSMLGHDIEIEKHFAQINAWKKATFPVYIVEQKVGDFVLVPPLAPHQVWNRGTRTIKVAWNRTTVETLELALHEALPKARLVCRDEQYKNKAIIYYTLEKYYHEVMEMEKTAEVGLLGFGQDLIKGSTRMKQIQADFKALFRLFTEVLLDEMFATKEKEVDYYKFDSCVTCSYCRANIFNRFLTCKHCVRHLVNGDEDTYDICMECYVMGRSCLCVSNLTWCEQWQWSDLVDRYEEWRALIIKNDGYVDFQNSPLPLELARKRLGKKSVAQICQEQLRRRPWNDLTKVDRPSEPVEESEHEVDEEGRPVKKRKPKRKAKKGDVYRCHVCSHKDYTYKLAFCSNQGCTDAYCYGVLYRAFDLLPQEVMQNERWQCPKCLGICNCGACRKAKNGTPYVPRKTLLGHDTRPIADDRSVEALIDFKVHNLSWLKNNGDETRALSSKRMKRLQEAAEAEKAKQAGVEVPALPDGEAADNTDAAVHEALVNGGYGDRFAVNGNGTAHHTNQAVGQNGYINPAEVADMSGEQDSQDQSSYPDPSALARERGLGMGYYDQDEGEDKILFDPYQMPTVEEIVIDDEPEPAEYLKKQLRIAKRRARAEEDDDPDFRGPRSHKRKRPKHNEQQRDGQQRDGQEVALSNMDPALFGDTTMVDAPADEDAPVQSDAPGKPAEEAHGGGELGDSGRPYSPNRPTLRHARPKVSYAIDERGEEEFNEILVPRSERPRGITEFDPENAVKDPLDLASAAIFATGGKTASPNVEAPPKKRAGRPPRKSAVDQDEDSEPAPAPPPPPKPARRPPRDRTLAVADLDAQLAEQLDDFGENGEVIERPSTATSGTTGPQRRGRPPKSAQAQHRSNVSVDLPAAPFMSMAERMKLKGKKFKIAQRNSKGTPKASTPATKASSRTASQEAETPKTGLRGRKAAQDSDSEDEDFDPAAAEEAVSEPPSPFAENENENSDAQSPSPPPRSPSQPEEAAPPSSPGGYADSPSAAVYRSSSPAPVPTTTVVEKGKYGPSPSPAPLPQESPSPSASESESESQSRSQYHSVSPSRSPSPYRSPSLVRAVHPSPPKKPSGPTVVRLMSDDDEDYNDDGRASEEEEDSGSDSDVGSIAHDPLAGVGLSDSDSDDDDEDIPVRKAFSVRHTATRGGLGGAVRGRGGGVIPSRGRPRGS